MKPTTTTSSRPSSSSSSSRNSSRLMNESSAIVTSFPPFLYVSFVIGMSIMGILIRLQIQDTTLPGDLLISSEGGGRDYYNNYDDDSLSPQDKPFTVPKLKKVVKRLRDTQRGKQHPKFNAGWDEFQRIEAEQTGRVVGKRTDPPLPEVHFIDSDELSHEDVIDSASWFQSTKDFLTMDIEGGIDSIEDATHIAVRDERLPNMRMSVDWLDFSLEHIASWCDMTGILTRDLPYLQLLKKLEAYVQRGRTYPVKKNNPPLKDALAIVAFKPYMGNNNKNQVLKAHDLNVRMLAATIESLRRAGFGRTVVVGLAKEEGEDNNKENIINSATEEDANVLAVEAFQLVDSNIRDSSEAKEDIPTKLGHMEVTYIAGKSEHAKTSSTDRNTPKAALQGLRDALKSNNKIWLGEGHAAADWKYVYLTNADGLLQTKPGSLPVLKQLVDDGKVLIPHRLQPVPHQKDVGKVREGYLFLSPRDKDFHNVMELDSLSMHPGYCCDEYNGPDSKPGVKFFRKCGKPWYQCGFVDGLKGEEFDKRHDRLRKYDLIRLTQGSQLVVLAAQNSGRKCLPPKSKIYNTMVCGPPPRKQKKN